MKMKSFLLATFLVCASTLFNSHLHAQEPEKIDGDKGFKKENLFTGGSIALAFANSSFLVGASPVFGYNLTRWADIGVVANFTYTSYRDVYTIEDKLRQKVFGGGAFTRLYPVKFLFAQAQFEHNWTRFNYKPAPGSFVDPGLTSTGANSFLIGAGYSTGRDPNQKGPYGYLAVLFDVMKDVNSPYLDRYGRTIPIIRAGIQIPLFQGKSDRY